MIIISKHLLRIIVLKIIIIIQLLLLFKHQVLVMHNKLKRLKLIKVILKKRYNNKKLFQIEITFFIMINQLSFHL